MITNHDLNQLKLDYPNSNLEIDNAVNKIHDLSGYGVYINEALSCVLQIQNMFNTTITQAIDWYVIDRKNVKFVGYPNDPRGFLQYKTRSGVILKSNVTVGSCIGDFEIDNFISNIYNGDIYAISTTEYISASINNDSEISN